VSIAPKCVRVALLYGACLVRTGSMRVRSLPKVFHTCGKNCGKSPGFGAFPSKNVLNPDKRPENRRFWPDCGILDRKAVTVGDITEP
jgi:hypothetical protein